MKKILLALSFISLMIAPVSAHDESHHKTEHVIDLKKEAALGNLSSVTSLHGSIHMSGQPDQDTLNSLKDNGFNVVINIRSEDETDFDEKAIVEKNGLTYYNIPLLKDKKIQDSAVAEIHAAIKSSKGQKILFHCSSGNRAASWLGAHLVRSMNYDAEKAVALSKEAGLTKESMEKTLREYFTTLAK